MRIHAAGDQQMVVPTATNSSSRTAVGRVDCRASLSSPDKKHPKHQDKQCEQAAFIRREEEHHYRDYRQHYHAQPTQNTGMGKSPFRCRCCDCHECSAGEPDADQHCNPNPFEAAPHRNSSCDQIGKQERSWRQEYKCRVPSSRSRIQSCGDVNSQIG